MKKNDAADESFSDCLDFESCGEQPEKQHVDRKSDQEEECLGVLRCDELKIGDVVRAKRCVNEGDAALIETLTVVAVAEVGWAVERADFQPAKLALETRSGEAGWIVRQKGRKPAARWFSLKKHGDRAKAEAEACRSSWEQEMARGLLVPTQFVGKSAAFSRYSLDEARKCEQAEAAALMTELIRLSGGEAEWRRRSAASNIKTSSSIDGDGPTGAEQNADPAAVCGAPSASK